jgi:SAM-dependent methyltransferase
MPVGTDSSADPGPGVGNIGCGYDHTMSTSATSRGLLFGTAAEAYERFRPGYPDEVVDRTLRYAAGPVGTAIEIGAGTGKATRPFACRGIRVTALEPDPAMFAVLEREMVAMPVRLVPATFEEYDGPPADLVYAAASWHWADPERRCELAAALLVDGGTLAIFGAPVRAVDPDVQAAVSRATGSTPDDPAFRPPDPLSPERHRWLDEELEDSGLFCDVEHHLVHRVLPLPQREYVGHLSTLSAYLELSFEDRHELLDRITRVLPEPVEVDLSVSLQLARRL